MTQRAPSELVFNIISLGYIYAVNSEVGGLTSYIDVVYDNQMSYVPMGVMLAPRVIEKSAPSKCLDFSFSPQSLTLTGFTLRIKLSLDYPISYSKIIISYWTNTMMDNIDVHSSI